MKKNVSEVFEEFMKAPTRGEKINVLRSNASPEVTSVLRGAFHPGIHYIIESFPVYKPSISPVGMGYSNIQTELRRVYLFEKNHPERPQNLTQKRMNEILIQMLESMEAKEAEIFTGMLTKNLQVPGLDYAIIKEAMPTLLP